MRSSAVPILLLRGPIVNVDPFAPLRDAGSIFMQAPLHAMTSGPCILITRFGMIRLIGMLGIHLRYLRLHGVRLGELVVTVITRWFAFTAMVARWVSIIQIKITITDLRRPGHAVGALILHIGKIAAVLVLLVSNIMGNRTGGGEGGSVRHHTYGFTDMITIVAVLRNGWIVHSAHFGFARYGDISIAHVPMIVPFAHICEPSRCYRLLKNARVNGFGSGRYKVP